MPSYTISAVLFEEAGWWVAQCLEYDLATQAKTLPDLHYELGRILVGHVVVAAEQGVRPFEHLPAAPQRYWDMFNRAQLYLTARRLPFRVPPGVPPELIPTPELRVARAA